MKLLFRIDQLLIFLVLSLLLIVMVDATVLLGNMKSSSSLFARTSEIENLVFFPKPGYYQTTDRLFVYNPNVKLMLSLNGGDSFQDCGSNKFLNSTTNENISHIPMSLHWKGPGLNLPELKSFILDTKSPENFGETESRVLTYYQDWGSDLPVVSLSIKNSNLFDETSGIMNYGKTSWTDSGFFKSWWYRSANFSNRGIEWERPINFQYFEKGELLFEQDLGMRISGNATRYFPQKSFRFYASKMYGKDKIKFPFWGNQGNIESKSILLRNGGNDNTKTLFADLLMHNLASELNVLVSAGKPVSVFINGNYWGIYEIRERIDAFYIAEHENANEDEVTILDAPNGTLKEGDEKEQIMFLNLVDNLCKLESISEGDLESVSEKIDVLSFIDYIILETFYGNADWPHNNCTWYKTDKDKKWKWIIYDLDDALSYRGIERLEVNPFTALINGETITSRLFNALLLSTKFKEMFQKRTDQILKSNLSEKNIHKNFKLLKDLYSEDIQFQLKRWRAINSVEDWQSNCNLNLEFLLKRRLVYREFVEKLLW